MAHAFSQENVVFVLYALRMELASIDEVEHALDLCRAEPGRSVADVLMENGVITAEQRIAIELEAEEAMESSSTMASVIAPTSDSLEQTAKRPAAVDLTAMDDASELLITDEHAGRYAKFRKHAAGGQARIILTFDEHLRREVALKELVFDAGETSGVTPTASQPSVTGMMRFLREARVTGMLEHPNIVPVYELGRRADGTYYYTMRFVRGVTLAHKLRNCESPADRLKLLGAFWDVCKAIAFAHSRGVVHRDIKPLNIMVGEFGETVVLDWGVAKVKGLKDIRARALQKEFDQLQLSSGMTTAGMAIGTPSYMSPEQARGDIDEIDERSDVWGLGALLYEILTGRAPYRGSNAAETMTMVQKAPLHPVQQLCPQVPPDLAAIAEKALQRERDQRYSGAKEMADEIGAYMTGEKVQAYEYSFWELLRRFVVRHKAAVIALGLMLLTLVASLLTARYMRIQELEKEIGSLASRFGKLEARFESLEDVRKAAFAAFDGDDFREGENKWRETMYLTGQLEPQYGDMWASLRGLLTSHAGSDTGQALKTKLLRRLMTVGGYSGRKDLSDYYRRLLLEEDRDETFRHWLDQPGKYALLSHPDGARLSLHQFSTDEKGVSSRRKLRDLGTTPLTGITLAQGSYLVEASLPGHHTVHYPLLAERGEDRVLSIPLPGKGLVPEGMEFIPPGEFLVGSDEQEEIRQHTGAVPRHRSYTGGFLLSANEVTFADYLPFLLEQTKESRDKYMPGGPYRLRLTGKTPVLSFRGQSRPLGEKFDFPECPDCQPQDWKLWPVVVARPAVEAFAKWKSKKLEKAGIKLSLRLPSEREWEKAARGADGRKYPCGEKLPNDFAATRSTHGFFQLVHEVGSSPMGASVFGINDLAGNVEEWVQVGASQYALKGGSFQKSPMLAMAASRVKEEDVYLADAAGFRLAASMPGSELCPLEDEIKGSKTVLIARARACRTEAERALKKDAYEKSITFGKRALALHQAAYGDKHSETASSYDAIGLTYNSLGQFDKGLEYLEKALAIRLAVLGPDHLDTGASYNNLGVYYHGKYEFDRALEFYNKSLDVRLKVYGPEHIRVADNHYNLNLVHIDRMEYDRALEHAQKALQIYTQLLGPNHPVTGSTHYIMGYVYELIGLYDESLKSYNKALGILLEVLGPDNSFTAEPYIGLASVYISKGSFKKAREYSEKAMNILVRQVGWGHFSTVDALLFMGQIEREEGNLTRSLEWFSKALDARHSDLGTEHPQVAEVNAFIGSVHLARGDLEKALEYHLKSLKVYESKHGANHAETVDEYLEVAHLHRDLGHPTEAREFFEKTWTHGKQVCGKGKSQTCANAAVARCQLGTCDQQAIDMADKGVALGPNFADTHEAKAFTLLKTVKPEQAKKLYCRVRSMGMLSQASARKRVRQNCEAPR